MGDLAKKKCLPCKVGVPPLAGDELKRYFEQLVDGWKLVEGKRLEKNYTFKNFKEALAFVNEVGKVAEEEGHHPDIELGWGKVKLTFWTHKIGGLSEADFVMAAKSDVCFLSRG